MSEASSYTANVFMPGCLGPVKRDVYLADDYDALRAKLDDPDYPPKHARRLIAELRAENERLRLDNLSKNGSMKAFGEQIAALQRAVKNRDKLKARAEQERDQLRAELAALQPHALKSKLESCEQALAAAEAELAALKAVRPVAGEREAFEALLDWAEQQICTHDNTHRGGAIWEICDDCGEQWADDRGGKPAFKWPDEIVKSRAALSAPAAGQDVSALVEAETEIRTFEDSNWHGSKGYHAGLLKAAGIVASLAAHKAGGGDHE